MHKTHGSRERSRAVRWGPCAYLAAAAALGGLAPAAAQAPRQPAPAPAPDPAYEAARATFEALPEATRRDVQDALLWTGDYASTTTGAWGRRTYEGVQSWRRRAGLPATGELDEALARRIVAAGAAAKAAAGFAIVADRMAGVSIGVPAKLLPKRSGAPNGGARFQSADERVTLDTIAAPGGAAELAELYERNLARETPGRVVGYKLLRPDFFVISGETPTGRFYTRYAVGPDGLRGFRIGYDKALAPSLDKVVLAISNSFAPLPAGAAGAAAAAEPPSAPPAVPPPREAAAAEARPPSAATGLLVAPRRVLAAAGPLEGCAEPVVAGARARVARREGALVALELPADRRGPAPPPAGPAPNAGDPLTALFVPAGENGRAVAAPAEAAAEGRAVAPLQEGSAGALLLDAAGRLVGIVARPALGRRAVAGLVPPASHPFLDAAAFRDLLPAAAPARDGAAPRPPGAVAAELAPAVLPVSCAPAPGRPR